MTASGKEKSGAEAKSTEIKEHYKRFIGRKIFFIFSSFLLIVIIAGIAATLGSYPFTVTEVYSIIWHGIPEILHNSEFIISHGTGEFFLTYFTVKETVIWHSRLPRILLAILAGIGLAIAGTMMQGILRNPLASPFTLGITSGAGFGAVIAGTLFAGFFTDTYLIIGTAFLFALIPAFIISGLTRYRNATPETMILAGIAMIYIFSGATTFMEYFGGARGDAVVYWMVGSLVDASWNDVVPVSIVLACFVPLLMWKSWDINVLGAGDETAKSLGVNVERTRIVIFVIASLLTAAIICFTRTIGFIGLVAPYICRMVIGGDNRFLVPASGLFGAVLLLGADTAARTIIAPVNLPVGALTYLMGGPLFFHLILRRKREYW